MTPTQFKIDQLRKENLIAAVEAIAFLVLGFFVTVYLPSLLYQFAFDPTTLTEEPAVVRYIPIASFVVAVAFFLYALVGNTRRMMEIRKLEQVGTTPMVEKKADVVMAETKTAPKTKKIVRKKTTRK